MEVLVRLVHLGPKVMVILALRELLVYRGFLVNQAWRGWASLDRRAILASGACQV